MFVEIVYQTKVGDMIENAAFVYKPLEVKLKELTLKATKNAEQGHGAT